jgi:multiple sugar transport system permease protein
MSIPPHWIPDYITFDNYLAFINPSMLGSQRLVGGGAAIDAPRALLNSTIVAFSVAIVNMTIGSFAGYAFARLEFRGSRALLMIYLATRMVPALAIMVSLYLIFQWAGLLDTLLALVLSYLTFTLPYSVWIMASYLRTIPRELEEAALIDGCTRLGAMRRVLLPLAAPGMVAAAIFTFTLAWNEFLYALIFCSSNSCKTLPVGLAGLIRGDIYLFGPMMAGSVIAAIPVMALYMLAQRFVVAGLAAGAVKG